VVAKVGVGGALSPVDGTTHCILRDAGAVVSWSRLGRRSVVGEGIGKWHVVK